MEIITGFDNGATPEEKERFSGEYAKVFGALQYSHEVAENVFARTSKTHFRSLMSQETRRKRGDEVEDSFPHWFTETSVTINTNDAGYCAAKAGETLAHLVEHFGSYLDAAIDEKTSFIVDSLTTKISQVGPLIYQFRVKQRWVADGG
jgi:hypothetical protein